MSPIEKTKSDKRKRKNYKFIRTFESLTEMDTYVRSSTKGTLHFHDFIHISKTYPLQSLKKKVFKDGSGYKILGIPVIKRIIVKILC